MPHKFSLLNLGRLDNPERRALLPPQEVLAGIGLGPGQRFLDVGAGAGYFALPASDRVGPQGFVIAVDTSPDMVAELRRRAGDRAVEARLCGEYDPGVAPGSIDLALLAFVLHEIAEPTRLLQAIATTLAPGGRLAVLEWIPKPTGSGPPLSDRMEPETVENLLRQTGLVPTGRAEINPFHYRVLARRPPPAEENPPG